MASYSGYSLHHFHRIFSAGFGDSLRDYIRKRRITQAGFDIIHSTNSILTIAIDYCYESQEAFSRAFQKLYNITPGEFRKKGLYYPIRNKIDMEYISFEIARRTNGMTPQIVHKNAMNIVGKKITIQGTENNYKEIPLFWQKWCNESYSESLAARIDTAQIAGVCITPTSDCLEYVIGHQVSFNFQVPNGYELFTIDASKYAVFTATGPLTESVQKTWDYIWGSWLISSGHTHSGKAELELYYCKDGKNYADICIPIA